MELSDYIRILRKNWIVIVAIILLALGASAVYSLARTPLYQSSSDIMVSTQSGSSSAELTQSNTYTQARVNSWVELASSPKVLDPVIHELGLAQTAAQLADDVAVSSPLNTTVVTTTVTNADPNLAADIA
ncbi:YveK family protein, partial [Microbacterium gubbeenense]